MLPIAFVNQPIDLLTCTISLLVSPTATSLVGTFVLPKHKLWAVAVGGSSGTCEIHDIELVSLAPLILKPQQMVIRYIE